MKIIETVIRANTDNTPKVRETTKEEILKDMEVVSRFMFNATKTPKELYDIFEKNQFNVFSPGWEKLVRESHQPKKKRDI